MKMLQDHATIPETREIIDRRLMLQRFLRLDQAAEQVEYARARAETGTKFAGVEWLREKVIRTSIEPRHQVLGRIARGEWYDGAP